MRRAITTGAALLWMALVLGLYYWVHKPLTPPLAEGNRTTEYVSF